MRYSEIRLTIPDFQEMTLRPQNVKIIDTHYTSGGVSVIYPNIYLIYCIIMQVDYEVHVDHLKSCSILAAKLKLSLSKHICRTSIIAAYGPLSSFKPRS